MQDTDNFARRGDKNLGMSLSGARLGGGQLKRTRLGARHCTKTIRLQWNRGNDMIFIQSSHLSPEYRQNEKKVCGSRKTKRNILVVRNKKTCENKKGKLIAQSKPLGKQLRRDFRHLGEPEIYHYPKTSRLIWKVAPDSNYHLLPTIEMLLVRRKK